MSGKRRKCINIEIQTIQWWKWLVQNIKCTKNIKKQEKTVWDRASDEQRPVVCVA